MEKLILVCGLNGKPMSDTLPDLPGHVKEQIISVGTKIADPATPAAHKSFLMQVLDLILKFLPDIIDLFHPSTTATLALGVPANGTDASGPVAGETVPDGGAGAAGGGEPATGPGGKV
jgi:hypothetical protein